MLASDHFEPPAPEVQLMPAADVRAPVDQGVQVEHQAFPVRQPEVDRNEFLVKVRASTLRRCRTLISGIKPTAFPWHELALGVATTCYGGFLGALPADLKSGSWTEIFFYRLLPIIGTGAAVCFLFLRRDTAKAAASLAFQALEDLPDPDETK